MPKKTDKIIEPINDSFNNVVSSILKTQEIQKIPKALYPGILPIADVELDCAVLDDGTRVLSATSVFTAFDRPRRANSRLEIDGIKVPAFMDAANLKPYINQDVLRRITPIKYTDGKQEKVGYIATLLPKMCEIYLQARRDKVLTSNQEPLAVKSEILLSALAQVGIDALVDEATGYQYDRKHNALRLLLTKYIAEGMQKWIHTFPDTFFVELDRLYDNEPTTSQKRPQYYGKFINKYIYDQIEHGYVKSKLNELNIKDDGKRKGRFHQWLSYDGRNILSHQIGRVQMLMEMSQDIKHFKQAAEKQKKVTIAPYLFDEMNQIID
jgi:hypothetical protein